jgi:hypothetical protein
MRLSEGRRCQSPTHGIAEMNPYDPPQKFDDFIEEKSIVGRLILIRMCWIGPICSVLSLPSAIALMVVKWEIMEVFPPLYSALGYLLVATFYGGLIAFVIGILGLVIARQFRS